MTRQPNQPDGITRKSFLAGIGASAMAKWGMAAEPVTDWRPAERWRGFNLLGMFRCPTTGLAPDPRVDGHFVEWEFKALHDWGFNFARLPIDYRILVAGDSWTNLSGQKMKHLDDAVRWGRQYGIHVQIALHRILGSDALVNRDLTSGLHQSAVLYTFGHALTHDRNVWGTVPCRP